MWYQKDFLVFMVNFSTPPHSDPILSHFGMIKKQPNFFFVTLALYSRKLSETMPHHCLLGEMNIKENIAQNNFQNSMRWVHPLVRIYSDFSTRSNR